MKITKQNIPPADRIWKATCRCCGSEAEAAEKELTSIQHDQREGGSFSWEECPVCKAGPYCGMLFYPKNP